MAAGVKNYLLQNSKAYLFVASDGKTIGCMLVTTYAESIIWQSITPLPSGVSLAKTSLTLGVTTSAPSVVALKML